ncbi:MAG: hypothetical protein O7G30_18035 [Proteobacteria bacterium]|nr:hypothetical protein [Pseudomonadota bacterium]
MTRRGLRYFIPGFFAFYFIFGMTRWIAFQQEIFPIGAWGMFQRIDKEFRDYDVLVSRMGGRDYVPPVSLRQPDNPLGIELDGQALLVVNGYVRFVHRGELDKAARYREFFENTVLGADATYEMVEIERRSRRSERHKEEVTRYGPFEARPASDRVDPTARFVFEPTKLKFGKQTVRGEERRIKRRKSAS